MAENDALVDVSVPVDAYERYLHGADVKPLFGLVHDLQDGLRERGIESVVIAVGSSARMRRDKKGNPNYRDIDIKVLPKESMYQGDMHCAVREILGEREYKFRIVATEPGEIGGLLYPPEHIEVQRRIGGLAEFIASIGWVRPIDIIPHLADGAYEGRADNVLGEHQIQNMPYCILAQ